MKAHHIRFSNKKKLFTLTQYSVTPVYDGLTGEKMVSFHVFKVSYVLLRRSQFNSSLLIVRQTCAEHISQLIKKSEMSVRKML